MIELIASSVVLLLSTMLLGSLLRRFKGNEQKLILAGFIAHVVAAFVQVWLHRYYYGYGDMLSYFRQGMYLADLLHDDFLKYVPEILALIFQQKPSVTLWVQGEGSSTGTMAGLAGVLAFVTGGSLYASCLSVSIGSFFGQLALYAALRNDTPKVYIPRLLVSCLLVPSVVFWSSGIIKEAIALSGLGFAVLGLYRLVRHNRHFSGLCALCIGVLLMGLSKPYLLGPFAVATSIWFYWSRTIRIKGQVAMAAKPLYFLFGLMIAMASLIGIGQLFPRYSIENLAEEAGHMQDVGRRVEGGSNYELASTSERTAQAQLVFVPIALVTALFRPFFFEVHNALSLINAAETTFIALVFLFLVFRQGPRKCWSIIIGSPMLMFCLIFVLLVALGVGLTATNLGTLSRYRIPMMPMYFVLLLMLLPLKAVRQPRERLVQRTNAD
ncbi:MAG: hypothetical protein H0U74_06905 [Bradymonadaceae bacterium]|nr:hypothetical protein [Lujinxingiaceae bacterium]